MIIMINRPNKLQLYYIILPCVCNVVKLTQDSFYPA